MSKQNTIRTRDEALTVIERFLAANDESVLAPYVGAMATADDEETFAMMRGSGNEMELRHQFLHLAKKAGLISQDEAFAVLDRYRALR